MARLFEWLIVSFTVSKGILFCIEEEEKIFFCLKTVFVRYSDLSCTPATWNELQFGLHRLQEETNKHAKLD